MPCLVCENSDLQLILSLGKSPLANSFLKEEDLEKEEPKFPLEIFFCDQCKATQLGYVVPPEDMFKNYVYVSSTAKSFRDHFKEYAEQLRDKFNLNKNSLVIDIGSNDGVLLKPFKDMGIPALGIEPADNIAKIANEAGLETVNEFVSVAVAEKIVAEKGKADVVTANNVFAHVPDIHGFAESAKTLLKDDGVYVVEVQYFVDMLEKMTFDNIYHEHLFYWTLTALKNLFAQHDMELCDVQHIDTHGGSLRVFTKKASSSREISKAVAEMLAQEKELGVENFELYKDFGDRVRDVKNKLVECLENIRKEGKTVAGYGAPAKSSTLLNFCGTGTDYIKYIVEDNPLKAGLYSPGTHIPCVPATKLEEDTPHYVFILAWNFAREIMEKTAAYKEKGVKFIVPLPEPRIVE